MSPRTDAATGEDFGWEGEATGLARPVDASQLDTRHGDILYLDRTSSVIKISSDL